MIGYKDIRRKIIKFRLSPIRVFCFHHVCENFDAAYMDKNDWIELEVFKRFVCESIIKGIRFVSLSEAYHHICNDFFRCRKYAVITFDDGNASCKDALMWLESQHIPVTLFLSGKYLDGISFRNNPNERYLTRDDVLNLNSKLFEIGHHGWEHTDASQMKLSEFANSVECNMKSLSCFPNYISFWAYTWGHHNKISDEVLNRNNLTPVLIDGADNYQNEHLVHREVLVL